MIISQTSTNANKQAILLLPYIEAAYLDSYKRLLDGTIEREIRNGIKQKKLIKRDWHFSVKIYVIYNVQSPLKGKLFRI